MLRCMHANVADRKQTVKEGSVLRDSFDASQTLATSEAYDYLIKTGWSTRDEIHAVIWATREIGVATRE